MAAPAWRSSGLTSVSDDDHGITLEAVEDTVALIAPHIVETPVVEWSGPEMRAMLPGNSRVHAKLELFQRSGTFKARGALSNVLRLSAEQLRAGVTAMSAGNHAVAVAYAAKAAGTSAKVVMQRSANPARVELAEALGAEILMAEDGPSGFEMVAGIAAAEGRAMIHPFDGVATALGAATLGFEMHRQLGDLDVLVVAIGGGGLAGGVSAITKRLNPDCLVVGVEPVGADAMHRSFRSGRPERLEGVDTIADSLAPPMTERLPFTLCRSNVDRLALVTDRELAQAMGLIFRELKLAVEPACAATTASLPGLADEFSGARVGLILCGSNIDRNTYDRYCELGEGRFRS